MAQSGEGWLDETRSAYLYRVIAEVERGSPRSELFEKLAREAEGQAAIWAKNASLASVPAFIPDLRTRLVAGLVRRYGPRAMRGVLAAGDVRASDRAGAGRARRVSGRGSRGAGVDLCGARDERE